MTTAPIKVAHAFSGIDGFGLGFGDDYETTAHIEWDKSKQRVLREHTPTNIPIMEDISDVHGQDIGDPEVLCGGFPCQDTSIAAPHRAGLDGARSHNFYEFARLVEECAEIVDATNPRWWIIENPTGLLKSRGGRDMATVIRVMAELGYGLAWRVVDGGKLGTPQRRGRIIMVGHRGGDPRPSWQVLGDGGAGGETARPHHDGGPDAGPSTGPFVAGDSVVRVWRKGARPRVALSKGYAGGYRETWVDDGKGNTLTGFDGGMATRQTHLIAQHGRLRTLSLTEWERLMGFPDGWTAMLPDSKRYVALGDAVHVGTARWLGQRLAQVHHALPQLQAS